jgi:hypothetical protein
MKVWIDNENSPPIGFFGGDLFSVVAFGPQYVGLLSQLALSNTNTSATTLPPTSHAIRTGSSAMPSNARQGAGVCRRRQVESFTLE